MPLTYWNGTVILAPRQRNETPFRTASHRGVGTRFAPLRTASHRPRTASHRLNGTRIAPSHRLPIRETCGAVRRCDGAHGAIRSSIIEHPHAFVVAVIPRAVIGRRVPIRRDPPDRGSFWAILICGDRVPPRRTRAMPPLKSKMENRHADATETARAPIGGVTQMVA